MAGRAYQAKIPNALEEWFDSPDYQSLIAIRDQAADVVIPIYEE